MANSQDEFSTELLRVYYSSLFPYESLFNWLSYGNNPDKDNPGIERDYFARREFSFTIEDDIYIRYQSFATLQEMKDAIQRRQPHKIDIGAVFSLPPKEHNTIKAENFTTKERELVFDIDMTDYDDIRTCCTGANICSKCWPFMTMAIKVVDEILREDFGYSHILWIYSGRRGVHCWVCDKTARELPNDARAAIVEYMSVKLTDSDNPLRKDAPIHPLIERSYATLEPYFERHIADIESGQGLLDDRDSYVRILNTLPNETIRKELYDDWERREISGAERWRQLKGATSPSNDLISNKRNKVNFEELKRWRMGVVLKYCYPRLDANVSKAQNHLLKSPFCVHPKTGRVCVPIDPTRADSFDPFAVPTVRSLEKQLNELSQPEDDEMRSKLYLQTDMKGYMECFERTFMQKLWTSIRQEMRERAEQRAAYTIDF